MKLKPPTEAEFTRQVLAFAKMHGWKTLHMRPGMTSKGRWLTAVAGDGKGFPDLFMVRGAERVAAELKVGKNRLTPEQCDWIAALEAAGVKAYCWKPENWPDIESVLG